MDPRVKPAGNGPEEASMSGIPLGELALLVAAVAGGGVLTGLMAGLFGIGGGAVIVPVLYEVFGALGVPEDVRMQACIGTSFAVIIPTTLRSWFTHRTKNPDLDGVVRSWTLPALAGVATGVAIATVAPAAVFKAAFAAVTAVIAVKLLFGRDRWRIADDLPHGAAQLPFGYVMGLAASLMGVSGGAVANVIMMLYGKPIHTAVATAAGLGVPIAVAGAIGFMLAGLPHQAEMPPLSIGYVSVVGFAVMAPVSSYVAGLGARLALNTPRRRLETLLGLYMAMIAVRFVIASM
jgi:uncharacterized membrane protein YfcA